MPTVSPPQASLALTIVFVGLVLAVAVHGVVLLRRARIALGHDAAAVARSTRVSAALALSWMAVWWVVARSGHLARVDVLPPPAVLIVGSLLVVGIGLARSRVGEWLAAGLPTATLIGLQAFRLPLELTMHRAASEGVMPVQMSFSGWNFDIVTGSVALLVLLVYRGREVPRSVALGFGVLGTTLLVTIVAISVASTPLLHAFGEGRSELNTWILFQPFVWLPTVLVLTALVFQLVLFRRLFAGPRAVSAPRL